MRHYSKVFLAREYCRHLLESNTEPTLIEIEATSDAFQA